LAQVRLAAMTWDFIEISSAGHWARAKPIQ
jgi:hypothetical protein